MSTHSIPAALPCSGDVLTLTVQDLTVDGGALARHGSLVVFLDRGLPGETVRATVRSVTPNAAKASVVETLSPSPDAVTPPCPHTALCGGCAWQDLAYPAQLAWKERRARETLRRVGKVDPASLDWGDTPILPSPSVFRYRNKVEFAFAPSEKGPLLGLRRRGSHEIVEVTDCFLSRRPSADILRLVRQWADESGLDAWDGRKGFLRFLVLHMPDYSPDNTPRCVLELITSGVSGPRPPQYEAVNGLFRLSARELPQVTGCVHSLRAHKSPVAYGEKVLRADGDSVVMEAFGPLRLEVPMQAFVQTNTAAALILYEIVRDLAALSGTEPVWDLYCGVGSIGLFLAPGAGTVRGFESVRAAVAAAGRNAALNAAANCSFLAGDTAALLEAEESRPDLVVVDPPRAGMDDRVITALARTAPERIISVSCDAATQARDIAKLSPMYRVTAGRLVDFFPHTPHLESVYLLEKT